MPDETQEYSRDQVPEKYPETEYVTVAQAAAALGIGVPSIRTAILEERLSVVRVFGRVLILKTVLEEYRARTQPDGQPKRGRPKKK